MHYSHIAEALADRSFANFTFGSYIQESSEIDTILDISLPPGINRFGYMCT